MHEQEIMDEILLKLEIEDCLVHTISLICDAGELRKRLQKDVHTGIRSVDVIESLCFSQPQEERVQSGGISDKTGKTAIIYRQVKERLDDEWFDYLIEQYKTVKENIMSAMP